MGLDFKPFPKAAQVSPKKPRRTSASRERIAEIRAKKASSCRLCGTTENVNAHHLIPRSLGGVWTESNIVGLCGSGTTGCHGDIEHHHLDALYQLRASLTDAEYSYVVEKAGEGFMDRYYPVGKR
jgi:5-methylcytosine-specific restriction endonuclease McrA